MQGSIGVGGPQPAIPNLSNSHPARVFDALYARHAPMTLTLLCQSPSSRVVDRLLVLFGKGIADQLQAQGLSAVRERYAGRYARMKEIFDQACTHHYDALVANRPIRLPEGSPLKRELTGDGFDIRQTIILSMQEFLEIEAAPFRLAHQHALEKIGERDPIYNMSTCLQNIWKEYQDLYAFLNYVCGRRQVHPWNLDRHVLISYEISLFKRELFPGKRAITVLKEWSKQTDDTKEIGQRLFACFSLIPLIDADIAKIVSGPRPAQVCIDRCDILLPEKAAFDQFMLRQILEKAFEAFIGIKGTASCNVFVCSYSILNPTLQTQQKLFRCLEAIEKAYSPTCSQQEYRQLAQLLEATKQKIDAIDIPVGEPCFRFIHAGLLLKHLERLLDLSIVQKRDAFDALYAADCRNLYDAWLMPLYPWPEGNRVDDIVNDIVKLGVLTGEKWATFLCHYAFDRLNLRPIPPTGSRIWRNEEKGDSQVLLRFLQELEASKWGWLRENIVYFLQDGYYAAPETLEILQKLVERFGNIPHGEEILAERACKGLQMVWKSYPFYSPLVQNAEGYGRLIPVLNGTHRQLEAMYPLHQNSSPSKPFYDFLLSLLLLCHLSRVIALDPIAKTAWFQRLSQMTPVGRRKLLQKFLEPHFEWREAGAEMDLERFLSRYPGLTHDQRTLLEVQLAFDNRNLRSDQRSENLSFSQIAKLIDTLEKVAKTYLPLEYVVTLLEKPCVPQKMEEYLNKWEAIAGAITAEAPHQAFVPPYLTQRHRECIEAIARIPGSGPIFKDISDMLSGILLPIQGWKSYQPFLFHLIQGDPNKFQRQWNCGQLIPLSPLRSLYAQMEPGKEANHLILRIVDNSLNTRTVRVSLPSKLSENWAPLLLELAEVIGNEYPSQMAEDSQSLSTDKLLQHICQACPQLRETIVPYTRTEANKKQLHTILRCLLDVKLGMRLALWQLFKGCGPVPQISLKEKRRLARQENIYRSKAGFSLLPLRDANAPLTPQFAIAFEPLEEKIKWIYEKLSSITYTVTRGNALYFAVAHDERDASEESGSSPESCSSDGPSLLGMPRISVDVHIGNCETRVLKDMADPRSGEVSIGYREIKLFVTDDRTTMVTDKFPIQDQDKLSFDAFRERICWLLAILQSEWYRKEALLGK